MVTAKKNSFVTIAEQMMRLNENNVKILAKLSETVNSQDTAVTVSITNDDGTVSTYSLPTVGKLQNEINTINNNIKRLAGLNNNTALIIDGVSTKKIYTSDLNREPNRIDSLVSVSEFTSNNNWFFESLMNPMLNVKFDLSSKVGDDVDGVISRRYMVTFEKDTDGNLTTAGLKSKTSFVDKFVNKTDINLKDFISWHTNATNTGIVNNTEMVYDEQIFEFDYQDVNEHGIFSVLKQEQDTVNNKLWYHIYPYRYSTIEGEEKTVKKGDEVVLNSTDSVTRWTILETSTASSNFRVRLERIEGYDPVPTGQNMLKFYGNPVVKKTATVSIGFDEYCVIFMKPLNSKNKLKGSVWSKGTGIYTNDLVLDTDNTVPLTQYYLNEVYDYGMIIKDIVEKRIPAKYGVKPNTPVLLESNFKVTQINKHLTDTNSSSKLKDLHSTKTTTKTKLDQINSAITQKTKELALTNYTTSAQKSAAQNELAKLIQEQESASKTLSSITSQIKSMVDSASSVKPIYHLRGFWPMPEPITRSGFKDQEVIQFKYEYRKSSKDGQENQTEGYTVTNEDGTTSQTGYYSNWERVTSNIRERYYDNDLEKWVWADEDISDADSPNITQLDIPIEEYEKIEIRVKSISEAGYPDVTFESDWSDILTIKFPDDLVSSITENQFIIDEATEDNLKIQFNDTLNTKGINKHVLSSFTNGDTYVAHLDSDIQTSNKDDNGNAYMLNEYLAYLTKELETMKDIIYAAKGKLRVLFYNGTSEVTVDNGSKISVSFICEQNGTATTTSGTYQNITYLTSTYYIKLENISTSPLSFLVREKYESGTSIRTSNTNLPCLVDKDNKLIIQEDNQFIYFCDTADGKNLYSGNVTHLSSDTTTITSALTSTTYIAGLSSSYINTTNSSNTTGEYYSAYGKTNDWITGGKLGTLICPRVKTIKDLVVENYVGENYKTLNSNSYIKIPINLYWKFKTSNETTVKLSELSSENHTKSLRVRFNPSSIDTDFEFIVTFNIKNKK